MRSVHLLNPNTQQVWHAHRRGAELSTASGKVGGKPKEATKKFVSPKACEEAFEKALFKKLAERYVGPVRESVVGEPQFLLGDREVKRHGAMALGYDGANDRVLFSAGTGRLVGVHLDGTDAFSWVMSNHLWDVRVNPTGTRALGHYAKNTYCFDLLTGKNHNLADGPFGFSVDQDWTRMLLPRAAALDVHEIEETQPERSTLLLSHAMDPGTCAAGALSPSGRFLVIGGNEGQLDVIDIDRREKPRRIDAGLESVQQVALGAADRILLALGTKDARPWLAIYDMSAGKALDLPDEQLSRCILFDMAEDGSAVALRVGKVVHVLELPSLTERCRVEVPFCKAEHSTVGCNVRLVGNGQRLLVRTDRGVVAMIPLTE